MNTYRDNNNKEQQQTGSLSGSESSVHVNTGFQLQDNRPQAAVQKKQVAALASKNQEAPVQKKANNTGLPDTLKSGIESLSGHSMDDVKVHYNSAQPAQLNAHAYAQGTDIHIASGQEKHLPHEAWHVVQQKQGRVKPTMQMKSKVNINDDKGLEKEADVMGEKAINTIMPVSHPAQLKHARNAGEEKKETVQRVAFGEAGGAFTTALNLSKEYDNFYQLEERYHETEDSDESEEEEEKESQQKKEKKELELAEINSAFKIIWEKNLKITYPKSLSRAVDKWSEVFEEAIKPLFNHLKTVTHLPPPLSNDTIHLQIGQNLTQLIGKMEKDGLEISGAGFHNLIVKEAAHFKVIREQLVTEPQVLKQLWGGDIGTLKIEFHPLGADNHGYAPPTRLDVNDDSGHSQKSLVHKARPGEVDKLVTELFKTLNQSLHDGTRLPTYEQALFSNKHLLSEFIEGPGLDSKVELLSGAANSVGRLAPEEANRVQLTKNIRLLEAVAKEIGLTDLHEENLILDETANQVVPIDLEAFAAGKPQETGLYGSKDAAPNLQHLLPEGSHEHIERFKEQLNVTERRFVPVATGTLYNMMEDPKAVALVVPAVKTSLEQNNFTVHAAALTDYIKECKIHTAIPSFTIQNGEVFGSPVTGHKALVAKRNDKGKKESNFLWANIQPLFERFEPLLAKADDGRDFIEYYKNPFKRIVVQLLKPGTGTISLLHSMVLHKSAAYEYVSVLAPLASYSESVEKNKSDIGKPWMDKDAPEWSKIAAEVIAAGFEAVAVIKKSIVD